MNSQEIDIIIEVIEETFGIETTAEKAKDFIECLNATRDQMTFVDTREPERKKPTERTIDLSYCCKEPIAYRKLSGAACHGEHYCTSCNKVRTA